MTNTLFFLLSNTLLFLLSILFPTPVPYTHTQEPLCSFGLTHPPLSCPEWRERSCPRCPPASPWVFHSWAATHRVAHPGLQVLLPMLYSHLFKTIARKWWIKAGRYPWIRVPPLAGINTFWIQHSTGQSLPIFKKKIHSSFTANWWILKWWLRQHLSVLKFFWCKTHWTSKNKKKVCHKKIHSAFLPSDKYRNKSLLPSIFLSSCN